MWKKIRGWGQNSRRCMWINGGEEHYKRTPCLQTVWIPVTSKELAVVLKKIKPPVIHYVGQPSIYVSVSEVITYHNQFRSCIINNCLSCLYFMRTVWWNIRVTSYGRIVCVINRTRTRRMTIFSETEVIIMSDSRKIRYRNDSDVSHGQWLGLGFLKSLVSEQSVLACFVHNIICTLSLLMIYTWYGPDVKRTIENLEDQVKNLKAEKSIQEKWYVVQHVMFSFDSEAKTKCFIYLFPAVEYAK